MNNRRRSLKRRATSPMLMALGQMRSKMTRKRGSPQARAKERARAKAPPPIKGLLT